MYIHTYVHTYILCRNELLRTSTVPAIHHPNFPTKTVGTWRVRMAAPAVSTGTWPPQSLRPFHPDSRSHVSAQGRGRHIRQQGGVRKQTLSFCPMGGYHLPILRNKLPVFLPLLLPLQHHHQYTGTSATNRNKPSTKERKARAKEKIASTKYDNSQQRLRQRPLHCVGSPTSIICASITPSSLCLQNK